MAEFAPGYCRELGRKCIDARAEIERLRAALIRISSVQLDEPPSITDPDWKARLVQGIARAALGPYRYRWEAEDVSEMLERGKLLPDYGETEPKR